MRFVPSKLIRAATATLALWLPSAAITAQPPTPKAATARIVKAANTFLATLDEKQRKSVLFAFDDEQQRARWSNFPTGFIPRAGISFKQMNPTQRAAALALLSATLSPHGYEKVQQIVEGDEVNKIEEMKHPNAGPPRGNGGPPPGGGQGGPPPGAPAGGRPPMGDASTMFGKDLYYFSILGTPSEKSPWMLQFGGHHLALNITIDGDLGTLTPTLTGAQPAMYTANGKTVRPLGPESDKGLALLNALDAGQKKQAILSYKLADLVLGPGQDGVILQPEGLKASTLNEHQRALLLDVIAEWAGIIDESAAAVRMAQLKADLNETWFSWSGPVTAEPGKNISAYYRIQGPHLVIEYAPQTLGGDATLHVHAMYRDPTNDYGRPPVKR